MSSLTWYAHPMMSCFSSTDEPMYWLINWCIGWMVSRGGDLRYTEWRIPLPGWEFGGDVSEHLSPRLQLPWGLLPRREHICQRLCLLAAPGRARATALCSILPAGALAPASRCDTRRHWPRHLKPHADTSESSHLTSGHLQAHFLHRETETPERCSAHLHN